MNIEFNKIEFNGGIYSESEAMNLGLNFYKSGQFQKAESIYRKVYMKNPKNADTFHLSALILYHYGWPDSAIYWIKRAVTLNSAVPQYYYNMGIIFMDKENYEEAKNCFQRALEIDDSYRKALSMLQIIDNLNKGK